MTAQLELLERPGSPIPDTVGCQKWIREGDEAMAAIVRYAGERFQHQAREFILEYLRGNGETSGEILTDRCRSTGITPPGNLDDRAFGPVYMSLSRRGLIEKVASCQRRKGHGTNGGIVWKLRRMKSCA